MLTSLASIASYPFRSQSPGATHQDRLEQFYKSQADSYDVYRERFLWGREPLLQACAVRLTGSGSGRRIWVDLGGGTGYNVEKMASILGGESMLRAFFTEIYIVDLCPSLCAQARARVDRLKWGDFVHVIETDAAQFRIQDAKGVAKVAQLVTLSYSLSMMPPFLEVLDHVNRAILDPESGLLGVCDFGLSDKYTTGPFAHSWLQRSFWKSYFDLCNIEIGPERFATLKHRFTTLYDRQYCGSIPWIPYFKPPYYVWIGSAHRGEVRKEESSVIHRAHDMQLTHPTMIYNMSWEDPAADAQVMDWRETDTVLTLTGGGCNALNLLVSDTAGTGRKGVRRVVSVDCNPAQSALLELKKVAFERLPSYSDLWRLFGEGKHVGIHAIYEQYLEPYLSPQAHAFWKTRLWYFQNGGLYEQGGMGVFCRLLRVMLGKTTWELLQTKTLQSQVKLWNLHWFNRVLSGNSQVGIGLRSLMTFILMNRVSLWFGCGVPQKQAGLLEKETSIWKYVLDTVDGVMRETCLSRENYFYWNVLTGHFTAENCPDYLKEDVFEMLRERVGDRLVVVNDTLFGQLKATPSDKPYDKVILMDHMDWQDDEYAKTLTKTLYANMPVKGRVALRSAASRPPYVSAFEAAGFRAVHTAVRQPGKALDRVNMYASFWVFEKL